MASVVQRDSSSVNTLSDLISASEISITRCFRFAFLEGKIYLYVLSLDCANEQGPTAHASISVLRLERECIHPSIVLEKDGHWSRKALSPDKGVLHPPRYQDEWNEPKAGDNDHRKSVELPKTNTARPPVLEACVHDSIAWHILWVFLWQHGCRCFRYASKYLMEKAKDNLTSSHGQARHSKLYPLPI